MARVIMMQLPNIVDSKYCNAYVVIINETKIREQSRTVSRRIPNDFLRCIYCVHLEFNVQKQFFQSDSVRNHCIGQ